MQINETTTRTIFADCALRCTPQRKALYETLRGCTSHPTVEELHQMVAENSEHSISLATVYNTVEAFCRAGLAKRLPTDNGSCRYDAETCEHLHVRFADTAEIMDVPMDLSKHVLNCVRKHLVQHMREQHGIDIQSINIELLAQRTSAAAE